MTIPGPERQNEEKVTNIGRPLEQFSKLGFHFRTAVSGQGREHHGVEMSGLRHSDVTAV